MKLKPRHQRLAIAGGVLAAIGVAVALVLNAFQSNLVFFYSPSQIAAHEAPQGRTFRVGGMVEKGSIGKGPDGVTIYFSVSDGKARIPVVFTGIVPDLFKDGSGVVAEGKLDRSGTFVAAICSPSMTKNTFRVR